jgi:hypothetical protein
MHRILHLFFAWVYHEYILSVVSACWFVADLDFRLLWRSEFSFVLVNTELTVTR